MRVSWRSTLALLGAAAAMSDCGQGAARGDASADVAARLDADDRADTAPTDALHAADVAAGVGTAVDAALDAAHADAGLDAATADTLDANRDRLLTTYLAWLQASPGVTQSNGLSGASVASVCDLWQRLDPSSRAVYLTITARLQGSVVVRDGSSMLSHVVRLYRLTGGQGATATDPGSCGGAEYNRMIMSMDAALHDVLVLANTHQGTPVDLRDVATHADDFWRNSHDLGGPHAPFDLSDETDAGAPRGQVQYFRDPTSTLANSPLGRLDLATLVDPYGLEMDEDYNCIHDSNPACGYVTYGPACIPGPSQTGTQLFTTGYGGFEPAWVPVGCSALDGG